MPALDWPRLRAALNANCLADAGASPEVVARLSASGSGAWADLLGDVGGQDVLVVDRVPSRGPTLLAQRGARVTVVEDDPDRLAVRRAAWPDGPVETIAPGGTSASWDIVVIDSVARRDHAAAAAACARAARVLVVTDNWLSPLRLVDRTLRRPTGPAARPPSIRHLLRPCGLVIEQRFGLLRSTAAPVTAFDLHAHLAAAAVLAAAGTHIGGIRRAGLSTLQHAEAAWVRAAIAPGEATLARRPTAAPTAEPKITGRIGYEASEERKVLLGEPPTAVDKRYRSADAASAEIGALHALRAGGLRIGVAVLGRPAPDRAVLEWLPGETLNVKRMSTAELEIWVAKAALVLRDIRRATAHTDGTSLVHGDFWLGNVLVRGGEVAAVIDWTGAQWGDPASDVRHLVEHLDEFRPVDGKTRARLHRIARAAADLSTSR